jgi:hemerythrin
MTYIEWPDDLNTGISIIDEQHKRIVQYINELHAARMQEDTHLVGEVLGELVDYTISHFAFEESLMEKADYPFVDPHKKVHSLFVERVGVFVERHKAGEDVGEELLYMLHKWLFNHIRNEDGDYAKVVLGTMGDIRKEGGWLSRTMHKFFG